MKNGIGKRKINRVGLSLSNSDFIKLKRLSISCDLRHTTMADKLLEFCLNDSKIMNDFQNKYNKISVYRVIPFKDSDGTITYLKG